MADKHALTFTVTGISGSGLPWQETFTGLMWEVSDGGTLVLRGQYLHGVAYAPGSWFKLTITPADAEDPALDPDEVADCG